jgi:hypothetical protein
MNSSKNKRTGNAIALMVALGILTLVPLPVSAKDSLACNFRGETAPTPTVPVKPVLGTHGVYAVMEWTPNANWYETGQGTWLVQGICTAVNEIIDCLTTGSCSDTIRSQLPVRI